MKIRIAGALVTAAVLAAPMAAGAAQSEMKVTGGGKTANNETIAFTAQGNAALAKGQFQYNAHDGTAKYHGTVDCVSTTPASGDNPATYEVLGVLRDGTRFSLRGTDGGKTTDGKGTDTVAFTPNSSDDKCDNKDDDNSTPEDLAHGNITVHKVNSSSRSAKHGSSSTSLAPALRMARLAL